MAGNKHQGSSPEIFYESCICGRSLLVYEVKNGVGRCNSVHYKNR